MSIKKDNKSNPDKTIGISFLGVDKRSMSAYEFFFNGIEQVPCELMYDSSQSQICLVDRDAYNMQQTYKDFRQEHPDKYILILSLEEHTDLDDKEFFLKKPVKKDALHAAVTHIYQLLSGNTNHILKQKNSLKKSSSLINNENASDNYKTIKQELPLKVDTLNDQADNSKIQTKAPVKEKPKVVTANAGQLIKVVNENDFVGEQTDIDINDANQLEKIYYEPNNFFQAIVEKVYIKSRDTEGIIQVNIFNHTFYFDHQEQIVYSSVGPGIIRPLCLLPHDNRVAYKIKPFDFRTQLHEISQANKNQKTKKTMEKQSWNMESFMWLITLWTSRGRLPKGTSLIDPVFLMQWPNLTRLDAIPHAVRIAALLYKQPRSLSDIAAQLSIEQRYVFAFFSACKAIGLSNVSRRQIDKTFAPDEPKRHENQSILTKILSKLTRF